MTVPAEHLEKILTGFTDAPFAWLWEFVVEVTTAATPVIRICNQHEVVPWNTMEFDPVGRGASTISESSDGTVKPLQVSISNVHREISTLLLNDKAFRGTDATLWIVDMGRLNLGALVTATWKIGPPSHDTETVSFPLQSRNDFQEQAPRDGYNRNRCRFLPLGSPRCGYIGRDETDCNGTLVRCGEIGLSEQAEGLVKIHPARYGGKPGIPRLSR